MVFTGRATYDTGIFDETAEDVSDMISMISPFETPLLDMLTQAPREGFGILHEWLEESLNPNTVVTSTAIASTAADTAFAIHDNGNPAAPYLQVGAVLKVKATGEHVQISVIAGNTITVTRGFGATTATSAAAGAEIFVISDAALEGADVTGDISRPRVRLSNYFQIFKKDIIISGSEAAVQNLGNVGEEYEHQRTQRMRESMRDLEKAVINGRLSGNTLGSATAHRTFRGLWQSLTTNITTVQSITSGAVLDNIIQLAYNQGADGMDLSLIVCDAYYKRQIDALNSSRVQVVQGNQTDALLRNRVTEYEGSFGVHRVLLSRWMPAQSLMVLDPSRIHVVPLRGRSFQHKEVAPTGDSRKGMILGEYTLEVKNQDGMAKCYYA